MRISAKRLIKHMTFGLVISVIIAITLNGWLQGHGSLRVHTSNQGSSGLHLVETSKDPHDHTGNHNEAGDRFMAWLDKWAEDKQNPVGHTFIRQGLPPTPIEISYIQRLYGGRYNKQYQSVIWHPTKEQIRELSQIQVPSNLAPGDQISASPNTLISANYEGPIFIRTYWHTHITERRELKVLFLPALYLFGKEYPDQFQCFSRGCRPILGAAIFKKDKGLS